MIFVDETLLHIDDEKYSQWIAYETNMDLYFNASI
jgi:hypothetical protein